MAAVDGSLGLCSTCNNAPTCFYFARRGPALFCELFDGCGPPAERITSERVLPPTDPSPARHVATSEYTGLCLNCEHRWTCTHPKPEGGVWHCEDYA